ncbi:hypothetical protein ACVIU7_000947 [Bradyrhizobium liaoningense]
MAGLVPAIHEGHPRGAKNVDGRDKPGHDGRYVRGQPFASPGNDGVARA